MLTTEDLVREVAAKLVLLDPDGNLVELDSLTVLDFVTELENRTGKTIPTVHIRRTNFDSIASIVGVLEQLQMSAVA